jgi:hypothetical protein
MRQSERKEWLLRIGVFGSALAVGALGLIGIWTSLHDYNALLLFVLIFAILFASLAYIVRKRNLRMLETG